MSLRGRLLGAFAYTLLVVIVALEVPLASNLSSRVNTEVEADAASRAQVLSATLSGSLTKRKRVQSLTGQEAKRLGAGISVFDQDGALIAESNAGEVGPNRTELTRALRGEISQTRRVAGGAEELVTVVPIVIEEQARGAVALIVGVQQINSEVRSDIFALIGIGLLALALGLGVAWILAGSLARPIRALAGTASRMSAGDLSARSTEQGSREQVELSRSFNRMGERVEAMVNSQRAFVADASHQLRTPLTGLKLRIEAAQHRTSDPKLSRDLEAAERESTRLEQLVTALLALASSDEPAAAGASDLAAAASSAAERWRGTLDATSHRLKMSGPAELEVQIGEEDLAIVLDNAIENASKYSPRGSSIELAWSAHSSSGEAALTITNAGGPIPEEVLSRGFERFYRGPDRGGEPGTGLGLAIVASLVTRAHGRAAFRPGEGANVVLEITLPVGTAGFASS